MKYNRYTIEIPRSQLLAALSLDQFSSHSDSWAYRVLRYDINSEDANAFRDYVLSHCSGYLVNRKIFKN